MEVTYATDLRAVHKQSIRQVKYYINAKNMNDAKLKGIYITNKEEAQANKQINKGKRGGGIRTEWIRTSLHSLCIREVGYYIFNMT